MYASVRALLSYFVYMVIVIVVAVPEGLPMSVTVSLALAMRKMTRANSLVRLPGSSNTIGENARADSALRNPHSALEYLSAMG